MAKHKKIIKKPVVQESAPPQTGLVPIPFWEQTPVSILLLLVVTAAVYVASIDNGFVFFDDDKAILYNKVLDNPSLVAFFRGQNLGMYAPLTWIGYWFGSLISGKEAWGYHLLGLLLHGLNTLLAFDLLRRLTGRHWPAFFAAALFAVHPVQVEAVSWAAALSTVLFSTFYLASAWGYTQWKRATTPPWYGVALILFVLASLSKSAAVTLPLVLVAIDYYQAGKWEWKFAWNKIPFFAISLFFGVYTFMTRAQEGHDIAAASSGFSVVDRFFMVCQTILFYPVKLLVPLGFSVSYPFVKENGIWPWTYYIAPLFLLVGGFLVWKYWRSKKDILLGLALYLLPLVVMLPFQTVGSFELRSDRYVYLSCLGLFLVAAVLLERQEVKLRYGILAAAVAVLGFLAFRQTKVWENGIALFENCVDKTPEASLCQCNLAYSELLSFKFDNAVYHYSEALKYDPSTVEAYNGRGQAYFQLRKVPEALDDFNQAIQAGIVTPKLFLNRGKCLVMLNRSPEALPDLDRSLQLEPNAPEAYFFRAIVHEKAG
ncbi:MAG: tetratricopeptide repeat protein, partial [Bacteroidetes bacterium]